MHRSVFLVLAALLIAPLTQAVPIDIVSAPGNGWNNIMELVDLGTGEYDPIADPNPAHHYPNYAIVPHDLWQPNGAGVWISVHPDAGAGDPSVSLVSVEPDDPDVDLTLYAPTAIFYQRFFLPRVNNAGSVTVWADDTAGVWLDGTNLWPANGQQGSACTDSPIGCTPAGGQTVSLDGLSGGWHTLAIGGYQRGGGPFGVLYQGVVDSTGAEIPEPASFGLMGGGLILAATALRCFRKV